MAYGAVFGSDADEGGERGQDGGGSDYQARLSLGLIDWKAVLDHPEVGVHVDAGGRSSLYRRRSLVFSSDAFDDGRVLANLDDLGVDPDEFDRQRTDALARDIGFGTLRLGAGVNAVSAAVFLRALDGRRPLQVGPDYLVWPSQGRAMGPASPPDPAELTNEAAEQRKRWSAVTPSVRVAVIDSGLIEPALGTDPLLAAATGTSVIGPSAIDPLWDDGTSQLSHWEGGHGTLVAGVLAEVAQGTAHIDHYSVCEPLGAGLPVPLVSDTAVATAVAAALASGCRVVNLSLSGPSALDLGTLATALVVSRAAGRPEKGGDAVLVAAAGNESTSQPMYPAALKGVLGVGAVDASRTARATFSNFGPWVDCCAVGVDVFGPYISGEGGPLADGSRQRFNGWATWSGTSFATPIVAGLVARAIAEGIGSARVAAATVLAGGAQLPPELGLGVLVG